MDAMDLLRSLTQGVNNKVVKEEETDDLEYKVKTSLRGKEVEDIYEDDSVDILQEEQIDDFYNEDSIYESGHKLEEEEVIKEETNKEEIVVKIPEKRKIDRIRISDTENRRMRCFRIYIRRKNGIRRIR